MLYLSWAVSQPGDICRCLLVIQISISQPVGALRPATPFSARPCIESAPDRSETDIAGLYRHICLDRDGDDLTGDIRYHFHHAASHSDLARGGQVIKQREKYCKDERTDDDSDRAGRPAPTHKREF